MKFFIDRHYGTYEFRLGNDKGDVVSFAEPLIWNMQEREKEGMWQTPFLTLFENQAQELLQQIVDQAWDLGIRPRYAKDGQPEVVALRNHLEDMRTLVFKV